MAVPKVIRSHTSTQPRAQPTRRRPDPQLKAEIFDTLRQLNRGYGSALAALHRLQYCRIFPVHALVPCATALRHSALWLTATCSDYSQDARNEMSHALSAREKLLLAENKRRQNLKLTGRHG